jgi:Flp pilus assembly protein TadG
MKKLIRIKKSEEGQSLIELGVSLTVLLIILVGVIELGMLFFQYIAMREGAQEGAVYASIYPTACNQTVERVKRGLYNVDPTQVEVDVEVNGKACVLATASDACASKEVRVTVHQPDYKITMPLLGSFLGKQTLDIKAVVTGTIIRPPCK